MECISPVPGGNKESRSITCVALYVECPEAEFDRTVDHDSNIDEKGLCACRCQC